MTILGESAQAGGFPSSWPGRLLSADSHALTLNEVIGLILFGHLVLVIDLDLEPASGPEALIGKLNCQGFALPWPNRVGGNMNRWAILILQDCGRRFCGSLAFIRHRDQEALVRVGRAVQSLLPETCHQIGTARAGESRSQERNQPKKKHSSGQPPGLI